MPSLSESILSSPPRQISSASQTPSLSASAKVPAQLQLASMTSFVVHATPSSQELPVVLLSQVSQKSGVPSLSESTLSSPPGQISSASQTPSLSASWKVPEQLQLASMTSFVVHALPSSQEFPVVLLSQVSQKSGVPSLSESTLSSPPGQISSASQTPSLSASAKVPAQLQLASMTSFVVHGSPSVQELPIVFSSQSSHPLGIPSPSES